jgi:hypothetical protein
MKKIVLYLVLAAFSLMGATTSCSDFGDTNIDPENLNEGNINYNLLFTAAQVQALGSDWDVWRNGIIYGSTMMQHTTSVSWNYVFYTYNEGYNAAFWDGLYSGDRGVIRDIISVIDKWKNAEGVENDYQFARIMKAYMFHRMTDLYGDIPYSEAGRIKEGIAYPKYDTQESIYNDLLKELNEAQDAINASAGSQLNSADLYFNGDPGKWKKFANSLILRIAMRLSKVNPAKAQEWIKTAVNNGIINQPGDNAVLLHTDGTPADDSAEPYGKIFSHADPQAFFLSEYFVNLLKNANDPRLPLIATVCDNPGIPYMQDGHEKGNPAPTVQVGMPVGYDNNGGAWDLSKAPGYPGENFRSYYSVPSRYTYADPQAPTMIVTYAENQLLLAEAAHRGWLQGTSETRSAKDYYESGVRAAMEQFSLYPNARNLYGEYLTSEAINNYLSANPFDESRALEMINTQYYIVTFCDEYESFANWRRTGYPALTPVNKGYPNNVTNGSIPRRFTYPVSESQSNATNYREAVQRLKDGDRMTSRVWWDAE